MKIEMGGIGVLPDISMDLDGMIVITGVDGTGKSTILKAVYSVLARASEFDNIVDTDIRANLSVLSNQYHPGHLRQLDEKCDPEAVIEELEGEIEKESPAHRRLEFVKQLVYNRNDEKVYGTIIRNSIAREFGDAEQFRRLGSETEAYFRFSEPDALECRMDQRARIAFRGSFRSLPRVVYYDSPFNADMIDDCPRTIPIIGYPFLDHRRVLARLLETEGDTDLISSSMNDGNLEAFDSAIEQTIEGMFVKTERGLRYRTRDGAELNVRNVAAGAKVFAIIRKLVDNGAITSGSILMLDEPEVHLHPLWINMLAECLRIMVHKMGVRIILTTHSPQLLMALESDAKKDGMTRFYYLAKDNDGSVSFDDVTDNLKPVYDEMASPIQDIASRFWK